MRMLLYTTLGFKLLTCSTGFRLKNEVSLTKLFSEVATSFPFYNGSVVGQGFYYVVTNNILDYLNTCKLIYRLDRRQAPVEETNKNRSGLLNNSARIPLRPGRWNSHKNNHITVKGLNPGESMLWFE